MRTIIFDMHDDEDPVHMGEIFEIIKGKERIVVKAIPEEGMGYCNGCVFFKRICSVPDVRNSWMNICAHAHCVFKPISDLLEEI